MFTGYEQRTQALRLPRALGACQRWAGLCRRSCWLKPQGLLLLPFAATVFQAYWGEDQDIAQDAVLGALASGAGP